MSAPAGPIFMGTSPFAVTVLERLAGSTHRPSLVVTPPDRGKGRGRRTSPPPAATAACELGLELHQTGSVNDPDSIARLRAAGSEVGVVCAFGQLIAEPVLSGWELLNVHPSLLPRWRGAAPIERAIMAGDERTGVCIIRLVAELDAGPIALRQEAPIAPQDDFGTLSERLAVIAAELVIEALDRRAAGELSFSPQAAEGVSYAEKIGPEDRFLDPSRPALDLERRVRALHPHVGARLRLDSEAAIRIGAASVAERDAGPGTVEAVDGRLVVGCGTGALAVERLQPPGGRMMDAAEWLRGNDPPDRVPAG